MELFRFHLVVLSVGHGARFYHIVWPFDVAIFISPYHGDREKARVMLRVVNPGAGVRNGHLVTQGGMGKEVVLGLCYFLPREYRPSSLTTVEG